MSIDQLSLAHLLVLAQSLPDRIVIYNENNLEGIVWRDTDKPINPREWEHVMLEAERALPAKDHNLYAHILVECTRREAEANQRFVPLVSAPLHVRLQAFFLYHTMIAVRKTSQLDLSLHTPVSP